MLIDLGSVNGTVDISEKLEYLFQGLKGCQITV